MGRKKKEEQLAGPKASAPSPLLAVPAEETTEADVIPRYNCFLALRQDHARALVDLLSREREYDPYTFDQSLCGEILAILKSGNH